MDDSTFFFVIMIDTLKNIIPTVYRITIDILKKKCLTYLGLNHRSLAFHARMLSITTMASEILTSPRTWVWFGVNAQHTWTERKIPYPIFKSWIRQNFFFWFNKYLTCKLHLMEKLLLWMIVNMTWSKSTYLTRYLQLINIHIYLLLLKLT